MRIGMEQYRQGKTGFLKEEHGSATAEFVIWTPIFLIILTLLLNVSITYFKQSQVLRVVQDANRAYSIGRLTTEADTEQFVLDNLPSIADVVTVDSVLSNGQIQTQVVASLVDLMPFTLLDSHFAGRTVTVAARQFVEY